MRRNLTKCFFSHVKKTPSCWLWIGSIYHTGYGCTKLFGETVSHRVSWIIHYGEIPKGKLVLHQCDIRNCVNPKHLWLGTQSENIRDCINKGRGFFGEKHGRSKVSEEQVLDIKKEFHSVKPYTRKQGKLKREELSRKYGICKSAIIRILNQSSWKHLKSPVLNPPICP